METNSSGQCSIIDMVNDTNDSDDSNILKETGRNMKDKESNCVTRAGRLIKKVDRYEGVSFKNVGTGKEIQQPRNYISIQCTNKKMCNIKNINDAPRNKGVKKLNSPNYEPLHIKNFRSKIQLQKKPKHIISHKEGRRKKSNKHESIDKKKLPPRNITLKSNSSMDYKPLRRKMRFVIISISSHIATMEITISHNWSVLAPQPQDIFEMLDGAEKLSSFLEEKLFEIEEQEELKSEAENFGQLFYRSKIIVYIIKKLLNKLKDVINNLLYENMLIEEVIKHLCLIERFGLKLPKNCSILEVKEKRLSFSDFSFAVESDSGLNFLEQTKPGKMLVKKQLGGSIDKTDFLSTSMKDESPSLEEQYLDEAEDENFPPLEAKYCDKAEDENFSPFEAQSLDESEDENCPPFEAQCTDEDDNENCEEDHDLPSISQETKSIDDAVGEKLEENIIVINLSYPQIKKEHQVTETYFLCGGLESEEGKNSEQQCSSSSYVRDEVYDIEENDSEEKIGERNVSACLKDESLVLETEVLSEDTKYQDVNGEKNFEIETENNKIEISEVIQLSKEGFDIPEQIEGERKIKAEGKVDIVNLVSVAEGKVPEQEVEENHGMPDIMDPFGDMGSGYVKNFEKNYLANEFPEIISIPSTSSYVPKPHKKKRSRNKKVEGKVDILNLLSVAECKIPEQEVKENHGMPDPFGDVGCGYVKNFGTNGLTCEFPEIISMPGSSSDVPKQKKKINRNKKIEDMVAPFGDVECGYVKNLKKNYLVCEFPEIISIPSTSSAVPKPQKKRSRNKKFEAEVDIVNLVSVAEGKVPEREFKENHGIVDPFGDVGCGYVNNFETNGLTCEFSEIISIPSTSSDVPKQHKKRNRNKKIEGITLNNVTHELKTAKRRRVSNKIKLEVPTELNSSHDKPTDVGRCEVPETPQQTEVGFEKPLIKRKRNYEKKKKEILPNKGTSELKRDKKRNIVVKKPKSGVRERHEVDLKSSDDAVINKEVLLVDDINLESSATEINVPQTLMKDVLAPVVKQDTDEKEIDEIMPNEETSQSKTDKKEKIVMKSPKLGVRERQEVDLKSSDNAVINKQVVLVDNKNLQGSATEINLPQTSMKNVVPVVKQDTDEKEIDALQSKIIEGVVEHERFLHQSDVGINSQQETGTMAATDNTEVPVLKNETSEFQRDFLNPSVHYPQVRTVNSDIEAEVTDINSGLHFMDVETENRAKGGFKRLMKNSTKVPVLCYNEGTSRKAGAIGNSVLKSKVFIENKNRVNQYNFQDSINFKKYKKTCIPATNVVEKYCKIKSEEDINELVALCEEIEIEDSLMKHIPCSHGSDSAVCQIENTTLQSKEKCINDTTEVERDANSELQINLGLNTTVSSESISIADNVNLQQFNKECDSNTGISSNSNENDSLDENSLLYKTLEGIANLLENPIHDDNILKEAMIEILNGNEMSQNQFPQLMEEDKLQDHDYVRPRPIEAQNKLKRKSIRDDSKLIKSLKKVSENLGRMFQRKSILKKLGNRKTETYSDPDFNYHQFCNEISEKNIFSLEPVLSVKSETIGNDVKGSHTSQENENHSLNLEAKTLTSSVNKFFNDSVGTFFNEKNRLSSHIDDNNNHLSSFCNSAANLNTIESAHSEELMNTQQFLQNSIDINFSQNTSSSQNVGKDDISNISLSFISKRKKTKVTEYPCGSEVDFTDLNW